MSSDEELMAYRELAERMEVVKEWLSKSMLKSKRLDNSGLLVFLASFFSDTVIPDTGFTSPHTSYNTKNVLEKETQTKN